MYLVDNITSTNTAQIGVQSVFFFFSLILSVCYSHKSDLWKDCKMSANYPKALQSWCFSKTVTQYWLWWTEVFFFWVNFPDKEKCLLIPQTGVSQNRLQRVPHDDYTCAACSPKDKREQHCKMGTKHHISTFDAYCSCDAFAEWIQGFIS